jgi:cold-inducible RNA-binding protein
MSNKLYVGQLSYSVDSNQLQSFFEAIGEVVSAKVITDRDSGRSKGFGFVEMGTENDAKTAVEQLNGKELLGRAINVSVARPQEERPRGGGGGFGGGRGGGGYGGGRDGGGGGRNRY